jgi:sensor c-di-GMP phosphodiesterase-like protein
MKLLAVLGIMLAVMLPVVVSIYLARYQSLGQERGRVLGYAREVLSRSEMTAVEIDAGFKALDAGATQPCSQANLEVMRRLDLSSSTIQAFGVIDGNRLLCSSVTGRIAPVEFGPPDVVQPSGVRIWTEVEFPFAKGKRFLVIGRGHYAAIVHKDLPIAVSDTTNNLSVATLSGPQRAILTARGHIKPEWLVKLDGGKEHVSFRDDGYIVAVASSQRFFIDAVAALPESDLDRHTWMVARTVVPFGLLMGALLAWAAVLLARAQLAMPSVLKAALRRKELFMVYQPVVDLRTGRWVGAEALIRWNRPKGETVRPDVFIVAAEDSGLIRRVTKEVVLKQVCAHARTMFQHHPDFHFAINLAADDLQSESTIGLLRELVEETGAQSGNLMVEATERSFAKPSVVRGIVDALRAAGIRIAIDDFGIGYSSLSFLESLPFDLLKIDKSFVDTLHTGAATSQVIHHIIEMAKALNLEMIAEGVESEAQAAFLRARGVHYAQGFLFAEPMSFDSLLEALHRQANVEEQSTG